MLNHLIWEMVDLNMLMRDLGLMREISETYFCTKTFHFGIIINWVLYVYMFEDNRGLQSCKIVHF